MISFHGLNSAEDGNKFIFDIPFQMKDILILMSTYNGQKYLSEQLDSIFAQIGVVPHILIRDDGSTDQTSDIIEHYISQYPNKINLIRGSNIGWRKSFFSLAVEAQKKFPEYNYFAFADQDDIWCPLKLKQGIDSLHSLPDGPKLYCSNVTTYKDGSPIGNLRNVSVKPTPKSCLIRNYATGCTMVFNRNLLDLVCCGQPQIKIAHDYWFYMVACLCGSVVVDDQSFIWYRMHDSNQVGFKSGFFEVWQRRLKSVSGLLYSHEKETTAKELLRTHRDSMGKEALDAVVKLAEYKTSFKKRLSLLRDNDYSYNIRSSDFWLKLRILFGQL